MIGGIYKGGDVPSSMQIMTIEPLTYAKFAIKGPMTGALQVTNKKIFNEWLPSNENMNCQKAFLLNGKAVEIFKTQITDQRFWCL